MRVRLPNCIKVPRWLNGNVNCRNDDKHMDDNFVHPIVRGYVISCVRKGDCVIHCARKTKGFKETAGEAWFSGTVWNRSGTLQSQLKFNSFSLCGNIRFCGHFKISNDTKSSAIGEVISPRPCRNKSNAMQAIMLPDGLMDYILEVAPVNCLPKTRTLSTILLYVMMKSIHGNITGVCLRLTSKILFTKLTTLWGAERLTQLICISLIDDSNSFVKIHLSILDKPLKRTDHS
jgi:hypothetical protein